MVPKKIHWIWIQGFDSLEKENAENMANIQAMNPDWEVYKWSDAEIRPLLQNLDSNLLAKYDEINKPSFNTNGINPYANKSDIARWAIVFQYGGCYMDLDITCTASLNSLLEKIPPASDTLACASYSFPRMYSDQFFMATPNNPIFLDIFKI